MQIIKNPEAGFSIPSGKIGVALGYFDGVHLGHARLIEEAKKRCDFTVVRIFESLPKADCFLTTLEEKLSLFEAIGVGEVIIDDFAALHNLSGKEFFNRCVASLSPSSVVCGYNYRFGKGAAYSIGDLSEYAREAGISCTVVPEYTLGGTSLSSSAIRSLISEGDVEGAAMMLGRLYSAEGIVQHGKAMGRTIGFPTINQRPPKSKLLPKNGVYSCTAEFYENGKLLLCGGVCNIGSRPTVNDDESDITLETYILDYSGELYSKNVKISFIRRLRDEMRFDSVESLQKAIENNAENARKDFANLKLNINENIL